MRLIFKQHGEKDMNRCLLGVCALLCLSSGARAAQVHDIVLKKSDSEMPSVNWKHDGDIHIFNFKLGLRSVNRDEELFKINCMHSGLWLKQLSGDFGSKDIKARYIQIQNRNGANYLSRRPTIADGTEDGAPEKLLSDANTVYDAGNFEEALKRYMAFYGQFSNHRGASYAMFMAGQSLCALLRPDDSVSMHTVMIQKYPNSNLVPDALYRIACVTVGMKNDPDKGRDIFGEIVKRFPDSEAAEDAMFALAGMELAKGRVKEATAIWNAYLRRYPQGFFVESIKRNLAQLVSVNSQQ